MSKLSFTLVQQRQKALQSRGDSFGSHTAPDSGGIGQTALALYTPEERRRRDESGWTLVQGILAPIQFLVFLLSLVLVARTLLTGDGAYAADMSIVAKILILYTIMVTGSIWEKVVFGKWLFAEPFFWEDVFSMLVLALHTAYLVMLFGGIGGLQERMLVALVAYAAYVINAGQFLLKLRAARLQASETLAVTG